MDSKAAWSHWRRERLNISPLDSGHEEATKYLNDLSYIDGYMAGINHMAGINQISWPKPWYIKEDSWQKGYNDAVGDYEDL
jgi:hypothetical protein